MKKITLLGIFILAILIGACAPYSAQQCVDDGHCTMEEELIGGCIDCAEPDILLNNGADSEPNGQERYVDPDQEPIYVTFDNFMMSEENGYEVYSQYQFEEFDVDGNPIEFKIRAINNSLYIYNVECVEGTLLSGTTINEVTGRTIIGRENISMYDCELDDEVNESTFEYEEAEFIEIHRPLNIIFDTINYDPWNGQQEKTIFTNHANIETGLTAERPDEDFGTGVQLLMDKKAIRHVIEFSAPLEPGMTFKLLGREYEFLAATDYSITLRFGPKMLIRYGEPEQVDGKTISIARVIDDISAVIDVDGDQEELKEGQTKIIGGLNVKLLTVYNDEGVEYDAISVIAGSKIEKIFVSGDEFIGQDPDDPDWVWYLDSLNTEAVIGVESDQVLNDPTDPLIQENEYYFLPFKFAGVKFEEPGMEYTKFIVSTQAGYSLYDEDGNEIESSAKTIYMAQMGGEENLGIGNKLTSKIAIWYDKDEGVSKLFYRDSNNGNKLFYSGISFDPSRDKDSLFYIGGSEVSVNINYESTGASEGYLILDTEGTDLKVYTQLYGDAYEYIGHSEGDTNTENDINYGSIDISDWEEDSKTQTGIIVKSYDTTAEQDEFEFDVPKEIYEVKVTFASTNHFEVSGVGDTTNVETN
ncbi:hypothetical protein K9L97_05305 [Candidatus Woesearchaeota archaeon]|nr:hypothetical protein [Candidatus Woesearchaeota archaeon]